MENNVTTGRSEKQIRAQLANLELGHAGRGIDERKRANGENSKIEHGLVGDLDPVRFNRRETPAHRTMVNMAAAGYTNREIAMFTGYNHVTVATAIKQPHAREYLIKEAKKTVQDEIKQLLEAEAIPSLQLLKAVRDNEQVAPQHRLTAANSFLDRFLGKAAQPIITESKPAEQLTDDELKARANDVLSRFSRPEGISESPAS